MQHPFVPKNTRIVKQGGYFIMLSLKPSLFAVEYVVMETAI